MSALISSHYCIYLNYYAHVNWQPSNCIVYSTVVHLSVVLHWPLKIIVNQWKYKLSCILQICLVVNGIWKNKSRQMYNIMQSPLHRIEIPEITSEKWILQTSCSIKLYYSKVQNSMLLKFKMPIVNQTKAVDTLDRHCKYIVGLHSWSHCINSIVECSILF